MDYRLYDVIAEQIGEKSFETVVEAEAERASAGAHGAKFEIIDGRASVRVEKRVIRRAANSAYDCGQSFDALPE